MNSRNALIFAGGVIACAALAASTLGGRFTPGAGDAEPQVEAPAPPSRAATPSPEGQAASNDIVFGDYEAFSDADLIDDTSGLDPMSDDFLDADDPIDEGPESAPGPAPAGAPTNAPRNTGARASAPRTTGVPIPERLNRAAARRASGSGSSNRVLRTERAQRPRGDRPATRDID